MPLEFLSPVFNKNKNHVGKGILWHLFPSFLLIILVSLFLSCWYTSDTLHSFYVGQLSEDLQNKIELVIPQFQTNINSLNYKNIDILCKDLGLKTSVRFTFILPSGKVIGDSLEHPSLMDNHNNRPEVMSAKAGKIGKSIRYSHTLDKDMIYIAVPIQKNHLIQGILRASIPITFINKVLTHIYIKIILGGLVIAFIAAVICLYNSKKISKSLEELENVARNFASGNLKTSLPISKIKEINGLSEAMNYMAVQLDNKIMRIMQQHNEQQIVLSNLKEGIIAVDIDKNIINLNASAAKFLGISVDNFSNIKISQIIQNTELNEFIQRTLSSNEPIESDTLLYNDRYVQAYGIPIHNFNPALPDSDINNIEAIIVLNDITRIKRLEIVRRDFVANVSHELRTPITSIKGFVETLMDGAIKDENDAQRFLNIIAEQADRLEAIIEDLLSLSRLEQNSEEVPLSLNNLSDILKAAVELCKYKTVSRSMEVNVLCDNNITANINPLLFEQAVVNLLSNAINYSDKGKTINLSAYEKDHEIIINVVDHGSGIAKEELPRIFERFYRVDKARSKKGGGTGLGLAIVKHIIQIHRGYVTVESTPSVGSTFSIHIPR